MNTEKNSKNEEPGFEKKVWIICAIVSFFVLFIWFFIVTFNVFLLILAGAMIALFFHGFAKVIERKLYLKARHSLLLSIISTFIILGLLLWFMGARIQTQVTELAKTLPATISNAERQLSKTALGQKIVEKVSSEETYNKGYSFIEKFFNSTFGVFTDIYIVLFLGLFFTAAPKTYINGLLSLIPAGAKAKARITVDKIGYTLTMWLKGQLFAMVVVAVLKWIALAILDVPMAIALALIAGILNFIPNFGSLISMFPAILIALTISVNKAIIVTIVYLIIQIFEGNVIAPAIQQKLINMPAALVIIAQLFLGVFAGVWGLILATPIVAIVIVVVQETYVKKINDL